MDGESNLAPRSDTGHASPRGLALGRGGCHTTIVGYSIAEQGGAPPGRRREHFTIAGGSGHVRTH